MVEIEGLRISIQGSRRNHSVSRERTLPRKNLLIAGILAGAGLLLLLAFVVRTTAVNRARTGAVKPWNEKAFKAKYAGSQLKQGGNGSATLTLSYELENLTDVDFHLAEGSGLVIARKLVSGDGLSQEEPIRLGYPAFLPAGQSARIAIEITQTFRWPQEDDPLYVSRLRDFVKERLANTREFVVFDEASRCQIELPSAWEELQETAQASY